VCYHGGRSRLTETNIKGSKRLDNRCGTLSDAVAWSINSLIAKLAYHRLSQEQLEQWAYKFGYGAPIPFELDLASSKVERVDDELERARMAAGFWHTYLSPLHGALMSAAVLNDGVMMAPMIVEKLEAKDGEVIYTRKARTLRRVMKASTATSLKAMMQRTATVGTARKYFKHRREFPKTVRAGGKTGTLSRKKPSYLGYTWFVGFGEDTKHEGVEVAVASLACNTPTWRIKGAFVSSEAIRKYIELERERRKPS
jgi:cell division protein FtsI/penicillin-binding protein 2